MRKHRFHGERRFVGQCVADEGFNALLGDAHPDFIAIAQFGSPWHKLAAIRLGEDRHHHSVRIDERHSQLIREMIFPHGGFAGAIVAGEYNAQRLAGILG